jgi:hypothetical protein
VQGEGVHHADQPHQLVAAVLADVPPQGHAAGHGQRLEAAVQRQRYRSVNLRRFFW